jgi:hypothetical protein
VNKDSNTMAKKGKKHIREMVKKYLNEIGRPLFPSKLPSPLRYSVGTVVRPIYRLSIMVSADVSQPIQKIIGIDCLMSADTINLISGIGLLTSADTNKILGIKGTIP